MASQVLPVYWSYLFSLQYDLGVCAVSPRIFWGTVAILFHIFVAVFRRRIFNFWQIKKRTYIIRSRGCENYLI